MAWPNSRLTTYTSASQIKANDLNAIQDAIIGAKHGSLTKVVPAIGAISSTAGGVVSGASIFRTGASGGTCYRALDLDAGARIVNIRVRLKDVAGSTCTAKLLSDVDGVQTTISTVGTSSGAGAYQTLTASGINHTVATGKNYCVEFTFGGAAANADLHRIEIDYDQP